MTKPAPSKHTRSKSHSEIVQPLSDLERLVRHASSRRRNQTPFPVPQQDTNIIIDPFRSGPIPLESEDIPQRFHELISKGVDFQSTFLVHSLESYKLPKEHSDSPISKQDLDFNLPGFKPTNFISPVTYSAPSTSHQPEDLFSLYSNPLFEHNQGEEEVQKFLIRTPLRTRSYSIPF